MTGSSAGLERPPLSQPALRAALVRPDSPWSRLQVVDRTGSTNTDLIEAAADTPTGTVLIAEEQSAGRGRLDRRWVSPARAGLTVSVLLRPVSDRHTWGWLPLLTGVALTTALRPLAGVPARLKWPNDVLIGEGKLAGILAQSTGDAVVVGVGLNVTTAAAELPEGAVSLATAGAACLDRDRVLCAFLEELAAGIGRFESAGGDAEACGLRAAYRRDCATLQQRVRVELPGRAPLTGTAVDVGPDGSLTVLAPEGTHRVASGDVRHVRPA